MVLNAISGKRRRRWRGGSNLGLGAIGVLLVSLLVLMRSADGAVMSIDLGSEWMKVAVVNLKPGQAPISIALNEMSKRKSPALAGFSNGERLLAEEAAGINVRYPERVYSRARDMVGKPVESVKQMLAENYLPYDVVLDERGLVNIRTHDKQSVFTSEELLAMVLGYGRNLAETHAKSVITDAVITVPPYFGQVERKAILDAAQIAGITVLALASEHSGAALQYGIDKDFSNETRNVIFYDMGANSLYAALIQFSSYQGKDRGKTSTFNQFQVRAADSLGIRGTVQLRFWADQQEKHSIQEKRSILETEIDIPIKDPRETYALETLQESKLCPIQFYSVTSFRVRDQQFSSLTKETTLVLRLRIAESRNCS